MRDWLTHRARVSPEATALVAAETGEEWDYAALDAAAGGTADRLADLGLRAGDHLGVAMSSRVEYVALVHAAMRLGLRLVPLSDRLTAPELAVRAAKADLSALVCDESTERAVVEAIDAVPVASMDDPQWERVEPLRERERTSYEPADWSRGDPMLMLFTSGTTGEPKLVVLTMGNVLGSAVASAFRLGVRRDDRWLVALSLHHMGGLAPLFRSTLYGSAVVLRREFDAGAVADDVDRHEVTGVSLVPTMLSRMLDRRGTLADSLRFVLLGGAPASDKLLDRCRGYSVPVFPTYGMTETASQIATATPEEAYDHVGTVGRPLLWTDVTVVDEDGEECDPGERGELVVSGPTVTPGYYGDAAATEAAFSERGLHTGDVGYRDETGRLYVLNRKDDRIVSGGENVDPGEVTAALDAHPGVAAAAVVGVPDETWGERVAALVVPEDGALDRDALEAYCRERLAGFKLPRQVEFVEELPRTVSGTIERETVRKRLMEAAVDRGEAIPDAETADAPRTVGDARAADEDGDGDGADGDHDGRADE